MKFRTSSLYFFAIACILLGVYQASGALNIIKRPLVVIGFFMGFSVVFALLYIGSRIDKLLDRTVEIDAP